MKKLILFFIISLFANKLLAVELTADLFTYDEAKVETEFADLNRLESFVKANPEASLSEVMKQFPQFANNLLVDENKLCFPLGIAAPGRIPSFWFSFTVSAVAITAFFIYGVAAGPISVGIVYFSSHKDKTEVKKAFWGCLAGTLIGAGIKYAMLNM